MTMKRFRPKVIYRYRVSSQLLDGSLSEPSNEVEIARGDIMNHFEYRNGEMFAEDVPLKRIAKEVGTPAYVYSLATLKRHFNVFDQAFAKVPHIVCFSVKANSNLALLARLRQSRAAVSISSPAASCFARSKPAPIRKKSSSPASARRKKRSNTRLTPAS